MQNIVEMYLKLKGKSFFILPLLVYHTHQLLFKLLVLVHYHLNEGYCFKIMCLKFLPIALSIL